MPLEEKLIGLSGCFPARFEKQKDGSLVADFKVAERKVFLSKKTLTYRCHLRVNEPEKAVTYYERLTEKGLGIPVSSSLSGDDLSPGFGFKKEVYKISGKERGGTIEEQSKLFGKDYKYAFDWQKVRETIKKEAQDAGYSFSVCLAERSV